MVPDIFWCDGAVQLCRLTLGDGTLRGINSPCHVAPFIVSADELFIALSPRNHDFSSVCPQLKTLELRHMRISLGALVDFVQRRVKSDLGDPSGTRFGDMTETDGYVGWHGVVG